MKRIANYLIALAIAAFTFTSCEDVPAPFGEIVKPEGGGEIVIEPTGSGTEADPYNVAAVLEFISGLGADTPSEKEVYIKGYVTETTDISAQYGNATFNISDTEEGANKFMVYRAKGLGNQNVTDESFIKVGDVVVICGKVTNYKGNTPETVQNAAYVYSVNGNKGGDTPVTPTVDLGTKDSPLTVAKALEIIKALEDNASTSAEAFVKGTITQIKTTDENIAKYKNIDYIISDGTNELTVFRGKNINNTDFTAAGEINVGDVVVVTGKLTKYVKDGNTTPEVAQGNYIVSLTKGSGGGGGGDTPATGNDGTLAKPFTAAEANAFIAKMEAGVESEKDYYIKGKIIAIEDKNQFNTQYGNCTFYISDDGTDSGDKFYVFRTLYLGNVKYADDSWAKPKAGDEVIICGKLVNYKGNTPETVANKSYIYSLNGKTEGGGGDTPATGNDGTLAKPFTAAEANTFTSALEAGVETEKDYYIKGKIIAIEDKNQFGTQYGNCTFYISDDGTDSADKFYVFRTLYLGNVKYADDSWTKPKAGDEVIICGKLVNYKGNTPETVANKSYIYSLNGKTSN